VEYYEGKLEERESLLQDDLEQIFWAEGQSQGISGDDMTPEEYEVMYADDEVMYDDDSDSDDEASYSNLTPDMHKRVSRLEDQFEEETRLLTCDLTDTVQLLLQATSHRERLGVLKRAFAAEMGRLAARKAIMTALDTKKT